MLCDVRTVSDRGILLSKFLNLISYLVTNAPFCCNTYHSVLLPRPLPHPQIAQRDITDSIRREMSGDLRDGMLAVGESVAVTSLHWIVTRSRAA